MSDMCTDNHMTSFSSFTDIPVNHSTKLPQTGCDIPMPPVKTPIGQEHICNTCGKEDVCMYKGECAKAAKDITEISERTNVFIDTDIRCKKWIGKMVNLRGSEI